MDEDEIAADRAVIDAATDGPWEVDPDGYMGCGSVYTAAPDIFGGSIAAPDGDLYPRSGYSPKGDVAFIAAARTGWPRALDALEAARADRDEWRENATTLRALLDNHAHNDEAMNQALRDVTVERDEANAEVARLRNASGVTRENAALRTEVAEARASEATYLGLAQAAAARKDRAEAAIARVRARHRPGFPDRDGKAECKECFGDWPCATIRDLDGEA